VRTHPGWPWLTPDANRFLDQWLTGQERILEFGCGGSTLFFARRAEHVTGVETSAPWKNRVEKRLAGQGLEHRADIRPQDPEGALHDFKNGSFDGVLVDGGDRLAAAEGALSWLKPGGILIVDNINRYVPNTSPGPGSLRTWDAESNEHQRWRSWCTAVREWPHHWSSNGVTDTLLLQKPRGGAETPDGWRTVDLSARD